MRINAATASAATDSPTTPFTIHTYCPGSVAATQRRSSPMNGAARTKASETMSASSIDCR